MMMMMMMNKKEALCQAIGELLRREREREVAEYSLYAML